MTLQKKRVRENFRFKNTSGGVFGSDTQSTRSTSKYLLKQMKIEQELVKNKKEIYRLRKKRSYKSIRK